MWEFRVFAVQNFALPGRGSHEPKSMDCLPRLGDSRQQCTPLNPASPRLGSGVQIGCGLGLRRLGAH